MKPNIYKNYATRLLPLCFALITVFGATAQTTVTIGTGTSSSYFYGPYYRSSSGSSFDYSRYAYLYTATELGIPAGATIIKVEWNKKSGTINGNNVFNIFMKNTSSASLTTGTTWGTLVSGATNVYASNTQSFMTTGWIPFTLDAPFVYTGNNLMVMTDHEKIGTASASNPFYYTSASGRAIGYASSAAPTTSTTLSTSSYGNNRPNIRITWLPPCPAEITVQPVNATTCADDNLTFVVATDSAQAYQWQVKTGASWINLADNATYSGTNATSLLISNAQFAMDGYEYRVIVTNTTENCSIKSDSAKMTVIPSPQASVVLSVGPDTNICQNEQVTFHTAYSNGGSNPEYRWMRNSVEIPGERNATLVTNKLSNGDIIQARFISSAQCVKPITSAPVRMNVSPAIPASVNVSIYSTAANTHVFTALPLNGGPNPEYYWYINGKIVEGEHSEVFIAQDLQPFDKVTVDMKTSLECAEPAVSSSRNVTTSIANVTNENWALTISPNPNNGQFTVAGTFGHEVDITVTNLVGQQVYNKTHSTNGAYTELPVSLGGNLPDGVYQVTVAAGNRVSHLRFVLNR